MLIATVLLGAPATSSAAVLPAGTIESYVGAGIGDGAAAPDAIIDPRGLIVVTDTSPPDLYIADARHNRVRRVDGRTGVITTIAGNGTAGFAGDGGRAQDAALSMPIDVARDGAGNLYVSDYSNNRIRKITLDGHIATLAGNGTLGYGGDGGLATQAALHNPWGVAVGPDGYVYVADFGNNRIRKIGPPGCTPQTCTISTVAGNGAWGYAGDGGAALSATLRNPSDVTFDGSGNMVIADWGNQRIRRVAGGIITTVAGGGSVGSGGSVGDGGPALGGVLAYPTQVAADAVGNIYIADTQQRRVRLVRNGIITTVAGTGTAGDGGDGGAATLADIYSPYGVAIGASGSVWIATSADIASTIHNRVRYVDPRGVISSAVGGGFDDGGAAIDALVDPRGADAVAAGGAVPDLYFADGTNNIVRRVDGHTATMYVIAGTGIAGYQGDGGPARSAQLRFPIDVAVDSHGLVYIADSGNNVVRRIDTGGTITTVAGTGTRGYSGDGGLATRAQLASPNGVGVDDAGNVYIADYNNNRIRKLNTAGIITTVAGNGTAGYGGDGGPAVQAALHNPWDVAVGHDGTLYIADTFNQRIRRVDSTGTITTYAGTGLADFSGDGGPAGLAALNVPGSIALNASDDLFIGDRNNARVRVVRAKTGVIRTVAGTGGRGASGDGGLALDASFSAPSGLAVDPGGGMLFIASNDDGRVRLANVGCAIGAPPARAGDGALLVLALPLALLRFARRRDGDPSR
jgi:streptogramin lyase